MTSIPFRRLLHWGPLCVLCIIKLITWAMVHVLGMWWPPQSSLAAALHAGLFLTLACSTLYYFLQSLLEGPGYVPIGWKPENKKDEQYLQYCNECKGYKAPRSHHCKKCGYCIKKMDHHCPWINCCVGYNNHAYFIMFLGSAILGCLHASIVLPICVYNALSRSWYIEQGHRSFALVYLNLWTLLFTLLAIGMAVGVVLAVSVLLFFQMRGILRNQTTIEEWIIEKAMYRRVELGLPAFVFPYDVGRKRNFRQVLVEKSDGLTWPVKEGCSVYDFTCEQQAQKEDKRVRSRVYSATRGYSGRWFPLRSRPCAACHAPCTDEDRLALRPGDLLRATRQNKYWFFGEKLCEGAKGPRGWFPRDSVVLAQNKKSD